MTEEQHRRFRAARARQWSSAQAARKLVAKSFRQWLIKEDVATPPIAAVIFDEETP